MTTKQQTVQATSAAQTRLQNALQRRAELDAQIAQLEREVESFYELQIPERDMQTHQSNLQAHNDALAAMLDAAGTGDIGQTAARYQEALNTYRLCRQHDDSICLRAAQFTAQYSDQGKRIKARAELLPERTAREYTAQVMALEVNSQFRRAGRMLTNPRHPDYVLSAWCHEAGRNNQSRLVTVRSVLGIVDIRNVNPQEQSDRDVSAQRNLPGY